MIIQDSGCVREAARGYLDKGLQVVPIPLNEKNPGYSGWEKTRIKPEDIPRRFPRQKNIGVLLGEPSNWHVDVDLDVPEALKIAGRFLPPTQTSGRASAPHSHWWYRAVGTVTKKFRDVNLKMLVELRSTGGQTVVYPSIHPSGEQYVWHETPDVEVINAADLKRSVQELATAVLIARHVPPEGGRHDFALALAGFMLRDGRLDPKTVEAILQAAWFSAGAASRSALRDISGIIADTPRSLKAGKRVKGGGELHKMVPHLPSRIGDYWEWDNEEPEEAEQPKKARFERIDLGEPIESGMEPAEMLVPDVLYAGSVHGIYSAGGKGKTFFALWLMKQVIEQDRPVMLLDQENGVRIVSERLRALGVDAEHARRNLFYYPFPSMPLSGEASAEFEEMLDKVKPALVVFDSWINFLASAGLDENSSVDIALWADLYSQKCRQRGMAVLLLDHIPKDGNTARGSGRKLDYVDVMWELTKPQDFDRETVGRIDLRLKKDREGWMPSGVAFAVGGKDGKLVFGRTTFDSSMLAPDRLLPSDLAALAALKSFGSSGVRDKEWREEAIKRGLARTTYYRARGNLLEQGHAEEVMGKYFHKVPAKEESHSVPPESHGTHGTTANGGKSHESHHPKGWDHGTNQAGTEEVWEERF